MAELLEWQAISLKQSELPLQQAPCLEVLSMWQYILEILLLRRLGLARPLRYFFLFALAFLTIVVFIYTANLFLTLE